jgi:hypothetical protein
MSKKKNDTAKESIPFDFRTIKSFEDACIKEGIQTDLLDVHGEFEKPMMAYYKLLIIYKAINNGWRPDWNDMNQYKYYPWFRVLSSGFGFSFSDCHYDYTATSVGSRLCTDTSEKALYIAKQFEEEYKNFLLYNE